MSNQNYLNYQSEVLGKIWSIVNDGQDLDYDTNNLYDLIREGVQAKKSLEAWRERCKILLAAKDRWMDRALAETERCARIASDACLEQAPAELRDQFAIATLQAITPYVDVDLLPEVATDGEDYYHFDFFARRAYEFADAMMEARKPKPSVDKGGGE